MSRRDARHRGAERRHGDARVGLRAAQAKAVGAHMATVVVGRLAGQDLAQAVDVSRMREALCAHSRSCHPDTITGLEAPSASPTSLPVRVATDETASAMATGLRTPTASGPIFSRRPGARCPIAVANATASNVAISPIQSVAEPGAPDLERDLQRLLVRPVEPERQHAFDAPAHSVAVSAGCPSRSRPGSSRDAALTWKCAVAVWASRKRR